MYAAIRNEYPSKNKNRRPRGRKGDQYLWPDTNAAQSISNAMVLRLFEHAVLPLPPAVLICLLAEAFPVDRNITRTAPVVRSSNALVRHHRPLQQDRRFFVRHTGIWVLLAERMYLLARQA